MAGKIMTLTGKWVLKRWEFTILLLQITEKLLDPTITTALYSRPIMRKLLPK